MPLDAPYAVPDPITGGWVDPNTGQPSSAPSIQVDPATNKQIGVTPVIDVGTPVPNAKPGEGGSQYRPIQTGPEEKPGKAMPAAPVETKPAEAPPPHPAAAAGLVELPDGTWGTQAEADRMTGKAAAAPVPGQPPPAHPAAAAGLVELPDGTWGTQAEADRLAKAAPEQKPATGAAPPGTQAGPQVQTPMGQISKNLADQHPWMAPLVDASAAGSEHGSGQQSIVHGFTGGLDEILSPIPAALARSLIRGMPFSQAYDQIVHEYRGERQKFEVQNPWTGAGLELAGGLASPLNKLAEPLFAKPAATTVSTKIGNAARNVAAASTVGGVSAALNTEGDLNDRLNAVPMGMATGAALGAAVPAAANLVGRGVQLVRPSANVPRIAGNILNETDSNAQFHPSPIAGVPMNVAESSGSPEMAGLVDRLGAERVAVLKRHRSAQNQALLAALPRTATTAAPEEAAATASSGATKAIKDAKGIIATEGKRVWGKASLNTPNISTATVKSLAEQVVSTLRADEPDLAASLEASPRLRQVLSRLYKMPSKASARQINDIRSRFLTIGRDFKEDGDVQHLARRFAKAVDDGMLSSPEIAGRPPVTAADVGGGEAGAAPSPRAAATAAGSGPAPPRKPQSLVDFLIAKGGVRPHGDFTDGADKVHYRQGGRLINPKGMTVHQAREAARDAGFFTGEAANDDRTLVNAVNDEVSGRPQFRPEDDAQYQDWKAHQSEANRRAAQAEDYRWQVRQAEMDAGITMTDAEVDHAVRTMMDNPHMHPADAAAEATRAADEVTLQRNAQAQAFTPPGMAPGATQAHMPEDTILREGAPPNPELVRDLKAARDFTRREHEVLDHAGFDAIFRRNSSGNETVVPGTALSKFYDFKNGVEKPGSIDNLNKFLGDIKSEWLKLGIEERAGTFDPASIQQVRDDLVQNTRDYMISQFLAGVSSADVDLAGDRLVRLAQAARWLETNRAMLQKTGMFDASQIDLLQRWEQTARMIAAGAERGKPVGSPTFTRLAGKNWADLFMGPLLRFGVRTGIGGTIGFLTGGVVGEEKLGAILGAEGNVGDRIIDAFYRLPKEKLTEKLYEAAFDPVIAADLMKPANARTAAGFRPATVRWLRAVLSAVPAGTVARNPPAEAPAQ